MPRQDGKGRGQNANTSECVCTKCGYTETHKRGVPCTTIKCPKCGEPLKGENCK